MRGVARAGIALIGVVALVAVALGFRTWNRVAHDNDFCVSCHSMEETFEPFRESEHARLNCRDCHAQPLAASLRQTWWALTGADSVGPHAPVDGDSCASCHITEDPDSTWQRISATAGHRVHLEAASGTAEGPVCLTCHAQGLHRFVPADATCGQSGCHDPGKTDIVLGAMAGQSGFHCATCHVFTVPVAESAPIDTARAALVPGIESCSACHEMENVLAGLDPRRDPHDAVCGTCHNPHTQEAPAEAAQRCSECHAPAVTLTPFHRGLPSGVLDDCIHCHAPHSFRVDAGNCVWCHSGSRAQGAGRGIPTPATSRFPHEPHREVACTECHTSLQTHGQVTLESRPSCQECHHLRVARASGCERCHTAVEMAAPRLTEITMTIATRTAARSIAFPHARHAGIACASCHTGGASMRVSRTCASCHENHHTATADCTLCHRVDAIASHTSAVHARSCAGSSCHEQTEYGSMTKGRNTCLACHVDKTSHQPGRACAACHRVTFAGSP